MASKTATAAWLRLSSRYFSHPWRSFFATAKVLAAGHLLFTTTYAWGSTSGPSMLPHWQIWGDSVITSRFHRRGRGVQVGDVVIFKIPTGNGDALKRVAGLPGDYVLTHSPESGREEMIQVPQGHFWALGDNLTASKDSRMYGPVPMALISGKVIYKVRDWPWNIQKVENPFEKGGASS